MDIRLALMCGSAIPIPECQLTIKQPTIKEISLIGETIFFTGVQCLSINKSMLNTKDKTVLENTSNFQIFMTIMTDKTTTDKKSAVEQVFALIFPNYKVTFLKSSLLLSGNGTTISIDESNFEYLQNVIKQVFCCNSGPMDQSAFNPADERARQIAEKLMKGRARVAAQQGQSQSSIFSQYLSVLTVGINSMSLQNCMDLTMYQLFDLVERYALYVDWDIDIRSRLAGGDPKTKPENWMKNIH